MATIGTELTICEETAAKDQDYSKPFLVTLDCAKQKAFVESATVSSLKDNLQSELKKNWKTISEALDIAVSWVQSWVTVLESSSLHLCEEKTA